MRLDWSPLEGRFVRLEPLHAALREELRAALDCDPETWSLMPVTAQGAAFEGWWQSALAAPAGVSLPYAVRRLGDGRIAGTTAYLTAMLAEDAVEIGSTFLHPAARGGAVNPEMKLLLLEHAFAAGAVRVQFKVDTRNRRSQAAVARLGAVREGVLRQDRRTWTGYLRDTVYFSILDREWPAVRRQLLDRVAALS
jgi:RimJ/RimL family protein N-acetyltransferase